jgi:hypothetical protein
MLIVAPIATVTATRAYRPVHGMLPEGVGSWVTGHMGRGLKTRPAETIFPMAYLVEQDPNSHLRPHFHEADQFQVVVAGGGTLGRHAVGPVSVHYTNAYTPYGPIDAGPEGVHYFTLRNGWDGGAKYLPESRERLAARPRPPRSAVAGPVEVPTEAAMLARADVACKPVIDPSWDGLGAWLVTVPRGRAMAAPDATKGNGQFWLVLSGAVVHGTQRLDPNSCIFVSHDQAPPSLLAGSQGAALLIVQFPRHS